MAGSDPMTGFTYPTAEDEPALVVPPEMTVEDQIDQMVGKPALPPERLITPMNPEGKAPAEGMGFAQNVRGQFNTSGLSGVMSERAQIEAARSGGQQFKRGGFSEQQFRNLPQSVRDRIEAENADPSVATEKTNDAYDAVFDQAAYDLSQANLSPASVAGSIVGTFLNPENFAGLSGLLVRKFSSLAARPVLTSIVDNAATNVISDVGAQAARVAGGAQEEYDPLQTAIGAGIGAGFGAAIHTPSIIRDRRAAAVGRNEPTPAGEPAKTAADVPAQEPAPLVDIAPRDPAQAAPEAAPEAAPVRVAEPIAAPRAPEPAPAPVAEVKPEAPRPYMPTAEIVTAMPAHRVATAEGRSIEVRPVVIEAADLKTSADAGYDAALQPRNRDRAASQAQIRDIATRLDPERLGVSAEADRGAPIVGPDGMVESGNGRVMAIREVYAQGGEAAQRYRDWLTGQGVDLTKYREPILVRERMTPLGPQERQKFTVEANQAATLAMSAPERAMADARAVSPDLLDLLKNPNDLGAVGNRDFVRAFVGQLPQAEQGALVAADGSLSAEGLTRVRNAVIARAYGDASILARIAEATSDDIKSISNALVAAAPDWAKLRADVQAGLVRADMDMTEELIEAVKRTADIRSRGSKLAEFLAQQDAFDVLDKTVEAWMRAFYNDTGTRAAGAQIMADRLRVYAQRARAVSEDALDLGLPPVDRADVQRLAIEKGSDGLDTSQAGLQFRKRPRVRADGATDGGDGQGLRGSRPEAGGQDQGGAPGGQAEGSLRRIVAGPDVPAAVREWKAAAPFETLDEVYQTAAANQARLGEAARAVGAELGLEFTDPGVKGQARAAEKLAEKGGRAGNVTDIVRGGYVLREPGEADRVVRGLAQHFELIDEGWVETKAGYVDRKILVRFEDGMVGEVQLWEPNLLEAKERRGGHTLYEEARRLPPDSPKHAELLAKMKVLYGEALAAADPSWREVVEGRGRSGSSPNRRLNSSSETSPADMPMAAQEAGFQAPSTKMNAASSEMRTGVPSQSAKSNSDMGGSIGGDLVFRKRGTQSMQALPPDQIQSGRPTQAGSTPAAQPVRLKRLEEVSRDLVTSFEGIARAGKVTPGAKGQYNTATGVTRVRSVGDLDTVAHEIGHSFHLWDAKAEVDAIVAANRAELTPLGAGDPKGDKEAFAELFRLYALNRARATNEFPASSAALDTLLRSKFPDQHKALASLAEQIAEIHRAPSGELVALDTLSGMPPSFPAIRKALEKNRGPSGETIYSPSDALYTASIDKMHPVWRAVENLKKVAEDNGRPVDVKPVDDAYIMLRLSSGSNATAGTILDRGVIPAGGTLPVGRSASEAIEHALGKGWSADKDGFKWFGAYLNARRMVAEYDRFFAGEIPNPPGKYSKDDYRLAVAEIERKHPRFAEAADMLYEFQTNYLKRAYDKGLYSKAYFDAAMSRRDYVPFVRDMNDFTDAVTLGTKRGPGDLSQSVMKKFSGSNRAVQNPLESIFKKVHDLEHVIARNDAVRAMAELADAAGPGSGAIAERIPSNRMTAQKVDVIEALKQAGKQAGVDEVDLKTLILQAEDMLGDSTVTTLFRQAPAQPDGKTPIVYYWVDGERRALQLADGRFGREMYHAFTAMNAVESGIFLKTLQAFQIALRAGVTRNPGFIPVNFTRDQFTAAGTAGRYYIPFFHALKGAIDVLRKSDSMVAYSGRGGMAAGAITEVIDSGMFGKNVYALDHAGVATLARKGDIWGAIKSVGHSYIKAVELSEAATRAGLFETYYKQAKAMGFDEENAVTFATFKATDYIDFRKSGAAMDQVRRVVPFLNANIQGTDREFRALLDLPRLEYKRLTGALNKAEEDRLKDARVAMVRVTLLGVMVGGGLAALNHDKPEWQSAPDFVRDNYFLFKVNDTWVSIPKPFGIIQAVVNGFERAAEYSFRQDPTLWVKWLEGAGKGLLPPASNPLVNTYFDASANYDRFRDRPIVPFYLQGVDKAEQYSASTSELAKMVGRLTGWSPMKTDYVLRNLGGSSASDLLRNSDRLINKDRPERQVYDWPVANRFVKNLNRGSAASTEFFGLVGEKNGQYEAKENAYAHKIRAGERTAAEAYLRDLQPDEKAWVILQKLGFEAAEKRLHPMQNAKDHVAVISGIVSQLNTNNVIHEGDLDRKDLTRSRRAAVPIAVDPSTRAKAMEALQELQVAIARNAMVAVGAKGTKGLDILDTGPLAERVKLLSPEVYNEYVDRRENKKILDAAHTFKVWPEVKARLLRDGEDADLSDLVPAGANKRRKRKTRALVDAE